MKKMIMMRKMKRKKKRRKKRNMNIKVIMKRKSLKFHLKELLKNNWTRLNVKSLN